jgi:hypothetical protein
MKVFIWLWLLSIFLTGCVETTPLNICEEYGVARACTKKEQAMIDGMQAIIRETANFEQEKISKSFVSGTEDSPQARVLFFAENHTDIIAQMEVLAAINAIAEEGDIMLLEGADRSRGFNGDCALELVFRIFENWQFAKLGQPYDPSGAAQLSETEQYSQMLITTKDSYDLRGLNITKLTCGYWDDEAALRGTFDYRNLKTRNRSQGEAIRHRLKTFKRVLINAGYHHMPTGDMLSTIQVNQGNLTIPTKLSDYYAFIKRQRRSRNSVSILLHPATGSTKVLYDLLKANNILFREYIHGRIVHR